MLRICSKCGEPKELTSDNFRQSSDKNNVVFYFIRKCRECEKDRMREYSKLHTDENRERKQKFLEKNPGYQAAYKANNKDRIRECQANYEKQTRVKLKKRVAKAIRQALIRRGSSKNTKTVALLPYSIEKLKLHLESQFEPWMNWENWGVYDPRKWDDNNPDTWTWQLDHVKPMASHIYNCESDPGFKDAWKLENLRPLKSKDNIILGARMKRANKFNQFISEVV